MERSSGVGAALLKVGPESAAADPGPACYGRGGQRPTVTDANVVLGYIHPDYFLGGRMKLDAAAAERIMPGEMNERRRPEGARDIAGVDDRPVAQDRDRPDPLARPRDDQEDVPGEELGPRDDHEDQAEREGDPGGEADHPVREGGGRERGARRVLRRDRAGAHLRRRRQAHRQSRRPDADSGAFAVRRVRAHERSASHGASVVGSMPRQMAARRALASPYRVPTSGSSDQSAFGIGRPFTR